MTNRQLCIEDNELGAGGDEVVASVALHEYRVHALGRVVDDLADLPWLGRALKNIQE